MRFAPVGREQMSQYQRRRLWARRIADRWVGWAAVRATVGGTTSRAGTGEGVGNVREFDERKSGCDGRGNLVGIDRLEQRCAAGDAGSYFAFGQGRGHEWRQAVNRLVPLKSGHRDVARPCLSPSAHESGDQQAGGKHNLVARRTHDRTSYPSRINTTR